MAGQNTQDFYYPSVLDSFKRLDSGKVDEAIRRAYDLIYKISPPASAGTVTNTTVIEPSTVVTADFIDAILLQLSATMLILTHEEFVGTTAGATWNAHQLDYAGVQYQIAAGSTTNRYIYWTLSSPNAYQTTNTFPSMQEDAYIVALYTGTTVLEVWQPRWRQAGTGASTTGVGTTNRVPKYTDGPNSVLGDSNITDTGSIVAVSTNLTVPDEVYSAAWDASLQVPTKNAIYDKIQTLTGSYLSLFDHISDGGNGGTAETDLYSDTIAAGQLTANGDKLEAEYGGVFVSSATATRQVRIYFGGTAIFDTGALTLSLSSAWTGYATLIRQDSATVRYMISLTTEGAALAAYTAVGTLGGLTLSNTNILKITGQAAGVGAASNDIVAKLGTVAYVKAAV